MNCLFGQPRCNTVWFSEGLFTLWVVRKGRLISDKMGGLAASFSPVPSCGHVSPVKLSVYATVLGVSLLFWYWCLFLIICNILALLCASRVSLRSTLCREVVINDLVVVVDLPNFRGLSHCSSLKAFKLILSGCFWHALLWMSPVWTCFLLFPSHYVERKCQSVANIFVFSFCFPWFLWWR